MYFWYFIVQCNNCNFFMTGWQYILSLQGSGNCVKGWYASGGPFQYPIWNFLNISTQMVQSRHLISDTNFTVGFVNIDTPSENLQLHQKSGMAKHLQTPEKRNLINVEMTVLKCDRWEQFYWILNEKTVILPTTYHGDTRCHRHGIRVTVAKESN